MKIFVTGAGGFIGGSIAAGLARDGHQVRGLVRRAGAVGRTEAPRHRTGDRQSRRPRRCSSHEARAADAVINAANSDHRGAVEALIEGLEGSNKPLLHTSGSSIVGDASGGEASEAIYHEDSAARADRRQGAARGDRQPRARRGQARRALGRAVQHADLRPRRDCHRRRACSCRACCAQARKSGVVRHVGPGRNIWSNVHIDDVVDAYRRALEKTPPGTFYFIESGEASFREMTAAMAEALGLGAPQDWPLDAAKEEWGYEMASYGLGSNSRVRGERRARIARLGAEADVGGRVDQERDGLSGRALARSCRQKRPTRAARRSFHR